jgi:hypothetical protein
MRRLALPIASRIAFCILNTIFNARADGAIFASAALCRLGGAANAIGAGSQGRMNMCKQSRMAISSHATAVEFAMLAATRTGEA